MGHSYPMTELNLRGLVERKKNLLFLSIHKYEFTSWNLKA